MRLSRSYLARVQETRGELLALYVAWAAVLKQAGTEPSRTTVGLYVLRTTVGLRRPAQRARAHRSLPAGRLAQALEGWI